MVVGYINGTPIQFFGGIDLCKVEIGKDLFGCKVVSVEELINGNDGFTTKVEDIYRFFEIAVQDKDTMKIGKWHFFYKI